MASELPYFANIDSFYPFSHLRFLSWLAERQSPRNKTILKHSTLLSIFRTVEQEEQEKEDVSRILAH
ncbi:MAG TPA: hypothetical protein VIJ25_09645 [Methylococcales bacterium]|jgi:hypothetical protein